MIVDMHCHTLTEEMIRLMQGVSRTYAPILSTTDTPYPCGLTTSSRGFTLTLPSRNSTTPWPEGGHNVVSIGLISGRIRESLADARRARAEASVSVRIGVEQGG